MLIPALVVLGALHAAPEVTVPKSGQWGLGINVEPLYLGGIEAVGPGGEVSGISVGAALQYDLTPHLSIRGPVTISIAGAGASSYWEAAFAPGLLYRWRSSADQTFVPYLGGGLKMGLMSFGRTLVGLVPLPNSDNQFDKFGFAPELWAGLEIHIVRFLAVHLGGMYSYLRIANADVHVFRETIDLRASF